MTIWSAGMSWAKGPVCMLYNSMTLFLHHFQSSGKVKISGEMSWKWNESKMRKLIDGEIVWLGEISVKEMI